VLILKRRRSRQPTQVEALSETFTRPSFLWGVFGSAERSLIGDASSRQGAGHVLQPTTAGVGLSSNAGVNYVQIANNAYVIAPSSSAFTVMQVIRLNATGQTNKYSAIQFRSSIGGGGTNCQQAIIYGYTANSFEFYTDNFTGSDPRTGSGIVVNDTLPHVLVYTYNGTTWSGYLDGKVVFSVARTFTVNITAATFSPESALLSANTGTNALNATLLMQVAWPSGLPAAQVSSLSLNPWQLFAPRRIVVPDFIAPGAAPTLSDLKATSITSSSVQFTYDYAF
jgi:hypothetical protein